MPMNMPSLRPLLRRALLGLALCCAAPVHAVMFVEQGRPAVDLAKLTAAARQEAAAKGYVQVDDMRFRLDKGRQSALGGWRWTAGEVHYQFDAGVTVPQRQVWRGAAAQWSAVADITFMEDTGVGNYIRIKNDAGNWSFVGMLGGEQEMGIFNWNVPFTVSHEIGHALGLQHEQSRHDRDLFVDVFWDKIEEGKANNFVITPSAATRGPYDFYSVMHYPRAAFSIDGGDTLLPKPAYSAFDGVIGQRAYLSALDQLGMAVAYGASVTPARSCGDNAFKQLGRDTGSWPFSYDPVAVGVLDMFSSISAGAWHSAGVDSDGVVHTWGHNNEGQLGDSTIVDRLSPAPVQGVSGVFQVSCGLDHSVALTRDGEVYTWGGNFFGQLGDGGDTKSLHPVKVSGLPPITQISASTYFTLALSSSGQVWGWGWNSFHNLSPENGEYVRVPIVVASSLGGNRAAKVSAGGNHCLAVDMVGKVWAWGWNGYGQIGDGTKNNSVPVPFNVLDNMVDVSAGVGHSLGLRNDGSVWSWGWNANGQLGDGGKQDRLTPHQIKELAAVAAIDAGGFHSMALDSDRELWCWGGNNDGRLGLGDIQDKVVPTLNPKLSHVRQFDGGYHHALVQTDMATLTMAASPVGSATTVPALGANVVVRRQTVTLSATPAAGLSFVGWTASPADNASFADPTAANTTVTLSGDATVTATTNDPSAATLTMAAAPADAGTTSPAQGAHAAQTATAFPIAATAATGYHFTQWTVTGQATVAAPAAASTSATLWGDATVIANFSVTPPPLSYHSSDYNPANWQIDLFETLRAVTLHNNGLYYQRDASTLDGFAPCAAKATFVPGTHHSADIDQNGQIDVLELSRVVTLFNGGLYYKVDAEGPDGYAPSSTPP